MSLKKYFEDKESKIVKLVGYKSTEKLLKEESYSHDFIVSKELTLRRFVPRVDYSDPKNFAFFGNAERYYEDSIKRIYGTYPYDDSPYEKEQWFLSSSYLDLYVFRNDYPKSTGYATISSGGWGTQSAVSGNYGNPSSKEYIYVKGGPHKGSEYNVARKRESNLKISGDTGNTIEFFLRKKEFLPSLTKREVIFDCATNDSDISAFGSKYGRFRVELDSQASNTPFLVTFLSGSRGAADVVLGQSITKSSVADDKWHHYAITVQNTGSNLEVSLFVDGTWNHTVKTGTSCSDVDVNLHANVGSLVTSLTSTSTTGIGWAKLSGSLDEVRFWKEKRSAEQIGSNWRHQVAGGSDFGKITADLGVYFKFNEGITGDASVDNVVLDYSGRISNGNWVGYTPGARSTDSAIVDSGANTTEFQDPIIRSGHPSVVALLEEKKSVGRSHDMQNSSALLYTLPNWMRLEDDSDAYKGTGHLSQLIQIMASYFDTLYVQTKVLPGLKNKDYKDYATPQHLSGSKPSPFSDKLLRSSGFIAPELFVESNIMDRILGQDENRVFEQDLTEIKNLIYKNIYNNLVHIYKSKGTESSFRNLLRCFGIDDELIKINMYASDYKYKFEDTYLFRSEKVTGVDFNHPDRFAATIIQQTSSYGTTHYVSGSTDPYVPVSLEADIVAPLKLSSGQSGFFTTNFQTSSIFGMHTPNASAGNTTWESDDPASMQCFVIAHPSIPAAAKFMLTSSKGLFPVMESPYYDDVYDDKHWVLSAKVRPSNYPLGSVSPFVAASGSIATTGNPSHGQTFEITDARGTTVSFVFKTDVATVDGSKDGDNVIIGVNGATGHAPSVGDRMRAAIIASGLDLTVVETAGGQMSLTQKTMGSSGNTTIDMSGVATTTAVSFDGGIGSYTVEFSGYNYITDQLQESFHLTSNTSVSKGTGIISSRKSVYGGANRTNGYSTLQHSSDVILNSIRLWQGYVTEDEVKSHALSFGEYGRLHPSRGEYLFESKSNNTEVNQAATLLLNWDFSQVTGSDSNGEFFVADTSRTYVGSFGGNLDTTLNTYHGASGFGFPSNSTNVVRGMSLAIAKENLPENVLNSSMVTVEDYDKERLTRYSRPNNPHFSFEKSMYQTISEEMVKMFATITEFNNLVGDPVNKYRQSYKKMDHLRSMFFANVENDLDLDKYVEFYKWFDVSIGMMLEEITPATLPRSSGIRNMVESHILERNKYQHRLPTMEFKEDDPTFQIEGVSALLYDWEHGHAPLSLSRAASAVATITTTGNPGNNETFTLIDADGLSVTYVFKTGVATVDGSKDGDNVIIGVSGASGHAPSVGDRMRAAIIASDLNVTVVETAGGQMTLTQNTKGASGNTAIDMSAVATTTASSFAGGEGRLQEDNCLWWKDRAMRTDSLSVSDSVDSDREVIRRVVNTNTSGSTYMERKHGRVYNLTSHQDVAITTGNNIGTNKLNDFYRGVVKFGTRQSLDLTASNLQRQVACSDVHDPNSKERLHGKMDVSSTDGYLDADSDFAAPFNIYSSSVSSPLDRFKKGAIITNNHGDSYHLDGETPLQGPFTSEYVGGRPHRNVAINVSTPEQRPEAYALEISESNLRIVHQPVNLPRSMLYTNEMIRRPVNIRNIRTTTGSYKVGNYREVYEYVLTNGRTENNNDFALNDGYTGSLYSSVNALATGLLDMRRPIRSKNTHVIVNRFSSPGGTETMGDSHGGPNLDFAAGEYSVYNSMNHRNSLVREVKNQLDSEYSEKFGLRSGSSPIALSYEVVSGSQNGFASVHMTNRNEIVRQVVASTSNYNNKAILFDGTNDYLEIDETRAIYKNSNEFSVFAWIKHDTVNTTYQHTIWSQHSSAGANRHIFGIKGTSTGNGVTAGTLFFYQEGSSWQSLSTTRVDDNKWHLVGFTYEGDSNTVRMYLDGKEQPGVISISNISDLSNSSSDKSSIGQEYDGGSTSDFFKGYISDLSIWKKNLSSDEVYEIYSDGEYLGPHDLRSHTATSDLAAWYRMGDGNNGSGTSDAYNGNIHDMSANSYHAVATNLGASAIKTITSSLPGTFSIYERRQQRDNAFVQHPIPRNDVQYSWIGASTDETKDTFIGHQHNFSEPAAINSKYQRQINYLSSAETCLSFASVEYCWVSDFSGLNYFYANRSSGTPLFYISTSSIDSSTNTISYSLSANTWKGGGAVPPLHLAPFRDMISSTSPYRWSSWQQVRGADHPVARYNRRNNNISLHLRNNKPNSSPHMDYHRPHGTTTNRTETKDRVVKVFQEPPVTTQYKPMEMLFGVISDAKYGELREDLVEQSKNSAVFTQRRHRIFGAERSEVKLKIPYANNMVKFANGDLMKTLGLDDLVATNFSRIVDKMNPNSVAFDPDLAMDPPSGFKYSETIYPREVNVYQKETRLRTSFVSKEWRETRSERKQYLTRSYDPSMSIFDWLYWTVYPTGSVTNSQNCSVYTVSASNPGSGEYTLFFITQSLWPLDSRSDFSSRPAYLLSSSLDWDPAAPFALQREKSIDDAGELQNAYAVFHNGGAILDGNYSRPNGAIYNRRIPQTVDGFTYLAGEAKWEAGDQAGKYPFEKNYESWAEEMKVAPDFSIVPEFRISEYIPRFLSSGSIDSPMEDFLTLTGSSMDSSSESFFKTYSNADFMKYFRVVKNTCSDLGKGPSSLFLKCTAMLKMLPYEGFYPATRTLKMCELFQEEYTRLSFDARDIDPNQMIDAGLTSQQWPIFLEMKKRKNLAQASRMLYAPGILYNSIKSGLAVDYPIFENEGTGSYDFSVTGAPGDTPTEVRTGWAPDGLSAVSNANNYGQAFTASYLKVGDNCHGIPRIKSTVYKRVTFEEMLNPDVLDGTILYDNEPHPSASFGVDIFSVTSHTSRQAFFDLHPVYGSIFSGSMTGYTTPWPERPQVNMGSVTNFSLAMNNFTAEVPNFFLRNSSLTSFVSAAGPFQFNRAEIGTEFGMRVSLRNRGTVMYDNPSAFGPPVDNNSTITGKSYGFAPYTPPFLKKDAGSYVDLTFTPTKRDYTLQEIFGEITSSYHHKRREHSVKYAGTNKLCAMQLTSSLNLFSTVVEPNVVQDADGNIIRIEDANPIRNRWVIQTKWETPVLNFANCDMTLYNPTGSATQREIKYSDAYGTSDFPAPWFSEEGFEKGSYLTGSRGMWHQYGKTPSGTDGYKLEITSISGKKSLGAKVGFDLGKPRDLGRVANNKEIGEAVVAIPYYVDSPNIKFFNLDPEDLREVMGEFDVMRGDIALTPGVNPAVRHQLEMMQKYIFPPQLDFLKFREKTPIAMYVFEFTHTLDRDDLTDIWQNLPAKIGQHAQGTQTATVGHHLVRNGAVLDPLSGEMQDKMRWMVFKVKRRAETSYFKKLRDSVFQHKDARVDVFSEGRSRALVASTLEDTLRDLEGYSYNWPYDYFSLVELIKVDASVVFKNKVSDT